MNWMLLHVDTLRLAVFAGLLVAASSWEALRPARRRTRPRLARWFANASLLVLSSGLMRLALPAGLLAIAALADTHQWGLLHLVEIHEALQVVLAIVLLDFIIYWQHRLSHRVPLLWRIHRTHHSDPDFDATTALRFHPIEMVASLGIKVGAILVLGASPLAVLLFELILSSAAIFNHSNASLGSRLDRVVRLVLVTPDMHRVHHSQRTDETNSNYGFNLPWWDRLFRSYKAQSAQEDFPIGIAELDDQAQTPLALLKQPLWRP